MTCHVFIHIAEIAGAHIVQNECFPVRRKHTAAGLVEDAHARCDEFLDVLFGHKMQQFRAAGDDVGIIRRAAVGVVGDREEAELVNRYFGVGHFKDLQGGQKNWLGRSLADVNVPQTEFTCE